MMPTPARGRRPSPPSQLTNTTAGGVISVRDSGDFGPVIINKSVTIDGGGIGGAITFTGLEGILVSAGSSDTVILRHLTVNGLGVGSDAIFLTSALNLIIEDCTLENFTTIGLGIGSGSAQNVVVRNTYITGGQLGLRVFQGAGPDQISMRGVTISGASQVGVFARSGLTEISDSVITQNLVGLEDDTNATINVANSVISYNATDVISFAPSTILVSNNNTLFANNGTGGGGGTTLSFGRQSTPSSLPDDKPRGTRQ
ncbi:MAG: right-handed parallel beta-helix repeat-containing protein [Acidobacteriia bacterium]|nr:right-handed parallel beta-helix repeat-containing protein [Terriglobia bacterium]